MDFMAQIKAGVDLKPAHHRKLSDIDEAGPHESGKAGKTGGIADVSTNTMVRNHFERMKSICVLTSISPSCFKGY